uniref:Coiled-coil domain containing 18 n=1 Tax=Serinus canaria TaxID=9135 RepID=A0A8C9UG23_SERCA
MLPMECSMWTCSKSDADDDLLANVQSLQNQLKRTEKNLQTVEKELSRYEWSYSVPATLDKTVEGNEQLQEKLDALHEQNASLTSQNQYLKNRVETMNFELMQSKTKISYLEAALATHLTSIPKLKEQIVNLEAEVSAQDKILKDAEDRLDQNQKTAMEREHMLERYQKGYKILKIELIEQSKQGKRAQQQRNEALLNVEELTRAFTKYKAEITEKLEKAKAEEVVLGERLISCEKEKEKLNDKCISYREDLGILEEQLRQLKEENHNTKEEIKALEAKNTEMASMLSQSDQKIIKLESELSEKEIVLKEKNALISENEELRALTAQQHDHLKLCHQEIEDSREELNVLETIISQLSLSTSEEFKWHHFKHQLLSSSAKEATSESCGESSKPLIADLSIKLAMKEAEIQKPDAKLTICTGAEHLSNGNEGQGNSRLRDLETEPVKLIRNSGGKLAEIRRKCQQLELISKQFEKVRQKFQKEIEELRTKLIKADDENSALRTSMAQRTSQFQIIQEDLLKKASKTCSLEREVRKKSSQLSALEKQLEEKTIAYSTAAERNVELELELMGKNRCIHELKTTISEEHEKITSAFENEKLLHLDQHKEMEKQITLLQAQLDKKHHQVIEQEKIISILQQEVLHKQHHIKSLDGLLIGNREVRLEMENQNVKKDQGLKMLESQLTEEKIKVQQLESALNVCKEEVALYLSQSQENKEMFENQLKERSEELHYLQKEIKIKGQTIQDMSEQNILLQQTLHHQQQMLQQETIRNGELEENQIKLEKQVSTMEKELQKQKACAEDELRKVEEKLRLAAQEADLNRQKVAELNCTIRQIKLKMDQCKNELTGMEKEVVQLKRDGANKALQINQLDIALEEARSELNRKANEDKLLQSETCHRKALQKIAELESALQNARGELKITLTQLQELQDALQNAQSSLEEKNIAIMDLTTELRYCKDEIEDKKQELLDMDQALKERNWELKQRVAQITQLDMTVREHKGEMEQQIIQLQCNLEKSELEIKECNKQIKGLEKKLQHSKDELREKEFELLQRDQEINHLYTRSLHVRPEINRLSTETSSVKDVSKPGWPLSLWLCCIYVFLFPRMRYQRSLISV